MTIETSKIDEQKMMTIEGMEKFDAEHEHDPQCVVPYVKEIMSYVRSQEVALICLRSRNLTFPSRSPIFVILTT